MENFKGTKGKWAINEGSKGSYLLGIISDGEQLAIIQGKDREATALLISKAPEMLEMLEKLEPIFRELNVVGLANEIEQLIKEATEL
jgi:hypothetical protein